MFEFFHGNICICWQGFNSCQTSFYFQTVWSSSVSVKNVDITRIFILCKGVLCCAFSVSQTNSLPSSFGISVRSDFTSCDTNIYYKNLKYLIECDAIRDSSVFRKKDMILQDRYYTSRYIRPNTFSSKQVWKAFHFGCPTNGTAKANISCNSLNVFGVTCKWTSLSTRLGNNRENVR